MSINKELTFEVKELLLGVNEGTTTKQQFISDCRTIARAYGVGYGYLLSLVATAQSQMRIINT